MLLAYCIKDLVYLRQLQMTVDEVLKDSVNYVKIDPLGNKASCQVIFFFNLYKSLFLWLAQGIYKNPTR